LERINNTYFNIKDVAKYLYELFGSGSTIRLNNIKSHPAYQAALQSGYVEVITDKLKVLPPDDQEPEVCVTKKGWSFIFSF